MRTFVTIAGVIACTAAVGWAAGDLERRAAEAVAAHRLVEARGLYRELAAADPGNSDYRIWVGRLSSWLNDYSTAIETFDDVLVTDPGNAEALVGKAYVAMWQERFGEAHALLTEAAAAAPDDTEVQLALARNNHFQGEDLAARRHVKRALTLDPGNAEAQDLKRRLAPEPRRLGFFAKLKRLITGRS